MLGAVEIWNGRGSYSLFIATIGLGSKGVRHGPVECVCQGGRKEGSTEIIFLNESGRRATDYIGPVRLAEKHCSG